MAYFSDSAIRTHLATMTADHDNIGDWIIHRYHHRLPTTRREVAADVLSMTCDCEARRLIPEVHQIKMVHYLVSLSLDRFEGTCECMLVLWNYWNQFGCLPADYDALMQFVNFLDGTLHAYQPEMSAVPVPADVSGYRRTLTADPPADSECSLCRSPLESRDVYELPCGHQFHAVAAECMDTTVAEWFTRRPTCPMCRRDVR